MYIGWALVIVVLVGAIARAGAPASRRSSGSVSLRSCSGLGAFDPHAPWSLLHKMPVFKSQHVPVAVDVPVAPRCC